MENTIIVDLLPLETAVAENTALLTDIRLLLAQVYTLQLAVIGVVSAIGVCYLLYRFLRKFF